MYYRIHNTPRVIGGGGGGGHRHQCITCTEHIAQIILVRVAGTPLGRVMGGGGEGHKSQYTTEYRA